MKKMFMSLVILETALILYGCQTPTQAQDRRNSLSVQIPEGTAMTAALRFAVHELKMAGRDAAATVHLRMSGADIPNGESYHIYGAAQEGNKVIEISAGDTAGQVYGLLRLAREIQLAGQWPQTIEIDAAPALALRMVDAEAAFYPPQPRPETPYWLGGYRDMYNIKEPPYIDVEQFRAIENRFEEFCRISLRNGYNSLLMVVVGNRMMDPEIWPEVKLDDIERQRLRQWRKVYAKTLRIAEDYGLTTYLWVSEVTLPEAVLRNLEKQGIVDMTSRRTSADVANPSLYRETEKKYRYLAETYPELDGFLVRVGELGKWETGVLAYGGNFPGTKNWSNARCVGEYWRQMETIITQKLHKEFIARSWWVGHPSLHTDPDMLAEATKGLPASSWLCIKHTHEFWGHLPLNPTLNGPSHPVLMEFQGCREYDGMGAIPAVMVDHFSRRIKETPAIRGLWTWVKLGGSGGHYRLPYFYGFEDWTEANVYAAGRLAWEPAANADTLRREFAILKVGKNAAEDYAELLRLSELARDKGLYVKPVCDENPWHPMFPTYRNYFYAGEIIVQEDRAKAADPVAYIFNRYRDRRAEMVADMEEALVARRRSVELAERIAEAASPEYGAALLDNVRHGWMLQQVLTQWIKTARAYYDWIDAGRSDGQRGQLGDMLTELKKTRERYDRAYGEYVDRDYGLAGFMKKMESDLVLNPVQFR